MLKDSSHAAKRQKQQSRQRGGEEALRDDALNTFSKNTTVTTGSANNLFIQNC